MKLAIALATLVAVTGAAGVAQAGDNKTCSNGQKAKWYETCKPDTKPGNSNTATGGDGGTGIGVGVGVGTGGDASASANGGGATINNSVPKHTTSAGIAVVVDVAEIMQAKTKNLALITTTIDQAEDKCMAADIMSLSPALTNVWRNERTTISCK